MKRTSSLSRLTFNKPTEIEPRDHIRVAQHSEYNEMVAVPPSSPMELSVEDELQATVEILRKTQEENVQHQRQLIHTKDQLFGKQRELERSKNCIQLYNQEIQVLQHELQTKNEELDEIKVRLQNQRESLTNYQHYFAVLKNNRWRLLAALVNTRMMIALGLERVRQLESLSGDARPICTLCR
ncbi:hypothetical protein B566_EDAN014824 [Ephemera danica]|nr:hypothetical protein B566_EDAN014824 [Ephemera danica]